MSRSWPMETGCSSPVAGGRYVPGHSPGHVALWSAAERILSSATRCSDTGRRVRRVRPRCRRLINHRPVPTIDRLAEHPVGVALSGHRPSLDGEGFSRLLDESRTCVERDLRAILAACSRAPRSFAELVGALNEQYGATALDDTLDALQTIATRTDGGVIA